MAVAADPELAAEAGGLAEAAAVDAELAAAVVAEAAEVEVAAEADFEELPAVLAGLALRARIVPAVVAELADLVAEAAGLPVVLASGLVLAADPEQAVVAVAAAAGLGRSFSPTLASAYKGQGVRE